MMTQRISIALLAVALVIIAIILLAWPQSQEQDHASWGQGFQWGNSKFGERR